MDEASIQRAETELIQWGVIERTPDLAITRRFRAGLARAAADLLAEEADAGRAPPAVSELAAPPLLRAVGLALAKHPLPPDANVRLEHRALVAAIEARSLPPEARRMLWGDVPL